MNSPTKQQPVAADLTAQALVADIKQAITDLGGGRFPDLMEAIDQLAALGSAPATPVPAVDASPTMDQMVDAIPQTATRLPGAGKVCMTYTELRQFLAAVGAIVQPVPASMPKSRDLDDGDMDAVVTAIAELNDGTIGFHGFCDRIIALAAPTAPASAPIAEPLSERERFMRDELGWKPPASAPATQDKGEGA